MYMSTGRYQWCSSRVFSLVLETSLSRLSFSILVMLTIVLTTSLVDIVSHGRHRHQDVHNNNNNNDHDYIYSAVIMTRSLREFTRFIWWISADPQTKPHDLGCESACFRQLASTTTSPFIIITQPESWYSFTVPQRVEGWVDLDTAGRVHTARAQGCKSQWLCDKHKLHNCPQRDSIPGPRALQSGMLPLDHCDLQKQVS